MWKLFQSKFVPISVAISHSSSSSSFWDSRNFFWKSIVGEPLVGAVNHRGGHHRYHHELKVALVHQATSVIALLLAEVSLDLLPLIVTKRMILLRLRRTPGLHQHPGCFHLIMHQLHYSVHIVQTQDLEVPSYLDLLKPHQRLLQHGVNMYGSSL